MATRTSNIRDFQAQLTQTNSAIEMVSNLHEKLRNDLMKSGGMSTPAGKKILASISKNATMLNELRGIKTELENIISKGGI